MGLFCLKHGIAPFPPGMHDCPACIAARDARRAGYEAAREQAKKLADGHGAGFANKHICPPYESCVYCYHRDACEDLSDDIATMTPDGETT